MPVVKPQSVLLGAWLAILLLPTASSTVFDGLPFSSVPEAVALAVFLPLALSPALRRLMAQQLHHAPNFIAVALLAVMLAGLTLKAALIPTRPAGFLACYRSTLGPPPGGPCERSYENAFRRFDATRIDPAMDFAPDTWNLSFFNAIRFNLYPWEPETRRRDRLPFTVTWRATIESRQREALVAYVGEGIVAIGSSSLRLPPAYDGIRIIRVALPPGRHALRIQYTFDDSSRSGDAQLPGPYATFSVRTLDSGAPSGTPMTAALPAPWTRHSAAMVDGLGIVVSGAVLLWYGYLIRRHIRAVIAVTAASGVTVAAVRMAWVSQDVGATAIMCLVLGLIIIRNSSTRLLFAYLATLCVAAWIASSIYPTLGTVAYRPAGSDFLTYEAFARAVLETWSLQGGESVFYVQPLFRYVRFVEHLVLGDGDLLLDVLGWTALHWCVIWAASTLRRGRARGWRGALFVLAAALTVALAGSLPVVTMIRLSLSEHITWIFLAAAVSLLSSRRPRRWAPGAGLLAAALITRPNQAPALVATGAALLAHSVRTNRRAALAAAAVAAGICALPLLHNLYYGGRPVMFTTTSTHPATLGVPIATLIRTPIDAAAREELLTQLRGLMFLPPLPVGSIGGDGSRFVMRGLQIGWLAAIGLAFTKRPRRSAMLLSLVPALYLAAHIVYDIRVYYPRHILAAYFAMGLVTMALAGDARDARPARREDDAR